MKRLILTLTVVFTALFSLSVFSGAPSGSAYLDGGTSKVGLILCHGRGKYPTWKVVDPLRKGINKQLGYHTLSLQMPDDDKNWEEYEEDFSEAYSRIQNAIRFLKKQKGVKKVFLMGHSMGSRMVSSFLLKNPNQSITGLIIAGCRNNGGSPFNCMENVENLKLPNIGYLGWA